MKGAGKDVLPGLAKCCPFLLQAQAGWGLPMVVLGGSDDGGIAGDTGTVAVRAGVKWR